MATEASAAWITRLPLSARLGPYRIHQKVVEVCNSKPRYRCFDGHALVVTAERPADTETKSYDPQLVAGAELQFVLRASVERRVERAGYDPVMRLREESGRPFHEIATQVAKAWLERQGKIHGFGYTELTTAEYVPLRFVRPRDSRTIRQSAIDMHGALRVTDVEAFRSALFAGIGRGRAWGLGLMLVRRKS